MEDPESSAINPANPPMNLYASVGFNVFETSGSPLTVKLGAMFQSWINAVVAMTPQSNAEAKAIAEQIKNRATTILASGASLQGMAEDLNDLAPNQTPPVSQPVAVETPTDGKS